MWTVVMQKIIWDTIVIEWVLSGWKLIRFFGGREGGGVREKKRSRQSVCPWYQLGFPIRTLGFSFSCLLAKPLIQNSIFQGGCQLPLGFFTVHPPRLVWITKWLFTYIWLLVSQFSLFLFWPLIYSVSHSFYQFNNNMISYNYHNCARMKGAISGVDIALFEW